jgi:hypothetical protein
VEPHPACEALAALLARSTVEVVILDRQYLSDAAAVLLAIGRRAF